jgi:hypothetical protein
LYKWGPREEALRAMAEDGMDVPALKSKPEVPLILAEVIQAYRILDLGRTGTGFGPNPISLSEVKAYFDLVGSPYIEMPIFLELIGRADRKHLELMIKAPKGDSGG